MFNFSFAEMLVVIIVAALVVKPKDLPIIARKFKEFKYYFTNLKTEFDHNLDLISGSDVEAQSSQEEDVEEINFYLHKIVESGETYTGQYNLKEIRAHYKNMQREKIIKLQQPK